MSRLIRDNQRPAVTAVPEPMVPLTSEAVARHIKECQIRATGHAVDGFAKYLDDLDEAFNVAADNARSNQAVADINGIQRLVRRSRRELYNTFEDAVSEAFDRFKIGRLRTDLNEVPTSDKLSLVDNDVLEETITISTITQKMDVFFAEPIWALNQRFALLNGGEQVVEVSNPAAPIQLCEGLRQALKLIPMTTATRAVAYRAFERILLPMVRNIVEDLNTYLKKSSILPNLRYLPPARRTGREDAPAPAAFTGAQEGDYHQNLIGAIRNLQQSLLGGALQGRRASDQIQNFLGSPQNRGGAVITGEQMLTALHNLQLGAHNRVAANGAPLAPVNVQQILSALGQQLKTESGTGAQVEDNDMATIDLVGLVFEYMLKDENLPDSVKALLSYLHTPFLKLAFIDPGFFEREDHPARLLLNNLAEAGARWVGNDGVVQHDILARIKVVVDKVLSDFKNDVRVIAEALLEFNTYTKNILRRQELMEKRAAEKAQGEERLREVKVRVNTEVRQRTDGRELPSAVLLFVLQPWSDYLSFTLLRYGDRHQRWHHALSVIDDLLWAIEPRHDPAEETRQRALEISLQDDMRSGFETIGYDQMKGNKLLEAVAELIGLALNNQTVEPAPAPVRDKLERAALEKTGQTTTAAERLSDAERKVVDSLQMIEFGTWIEFEGGKRLKVAWFNSRTSHYMLVDQMGKRAAVMTGPEIAREMIAKRARIIAGSSKPFFDRALENIFQKLNAQAEAQSRDPADE